MKSAAQYNEMTKKAAYRIVKALAAFNGEPDHVRRQAEQLIMQRVGLMRYGDQTVIEGDGLIKEYVEPKAPEPSEPTSNEDPPAP